MLNGPQYARAVASGTGSAGAVIQPYSTRHRVPQSVISYLPYLYCVILTILLRFEQLRIAAAWISCITVAIPISLYICIVRWKRLHASNSISITQYFGLVCVFGGLSICGAGIAKMGKYWWLNFYSYLFYIGFGLLFIADSIYIVRRNPTQIQTSSRGKEKRFLKYTICIILYICAIIAVFYLDQIRHGIVNGSVTASLHIPVDYKSRCRVRRTAMNGTISLIWPHGSNNAKCVYVYWEHLRGLVLFTLVFIILVSLLKTQLSELKAWSNAAHILSLIFFFLAVSLFVDDLDHPWEVTDTVLIFIIIACALGCIAHKVE